MRPRVSAVADRLVAVADLRTERGSAVAHQGTRERLDRLREAAGAVAAAYADAPAETDVDQRLGQVARVFGLDQSASDLLAAAVAVEVDDRLASLADLLTGGHGGHLSVGLALELVGLGTAGAEAAHLIDDGAPLVGQGLVHLDRTGTRPRWSVRADPRVVAHVLGAAGLAERVEMLRRETVPTITEVSRQAAAAFEHGAPLVWLRGPANGPAVAHAAGAFTLLGLPHLVVDAASMPSRLDVAEVLATAAREAALTGHGLVVTGVDIEAEAAERAGHEVTWIGLLERATVPVVVVSSHRWRHGWTRRTPLLLEVDPLTPADRRTLWERASGLAGEALDPVVALQLAPEQIRDAVDYADLVRAATDAPEALVTAARALDASRAAPTVMDHAPRARLQLSDLVLPQRTKTEIERVIRWGRLHAGLSQQARGPYAHSSKGSGLAVLLTGGPGTGKTLAGHVIADELGLEVMQVSLSSTIDKYIGETEKNLERIFAAAEARQVLLFFDEADALFGSRSEVRDAKDRYANQEVSYLLQRIEYFNGLILLATNFHGNIDQAFTRRIHLVVPFPDPDEAARGELWRTHLVPGGPVDPDDQPDLGLLAGLDLTGGEIRNICLGALYDAMSLGVPVGMRHLQSAALREYRKQGRRDPVALAGP